MPPNQIFKISGQIGQISGHLVNFRTLFKISGISGPRSGLIIKTIFSGAVDVTVLGQFQIETKSTATVSK